MSDVARDSKMLAGSADGPIAARAETWDSGAGFYLTMSIVAAVIIVAGFTPSFYLKSVLHAPPPLSLLSITHGVVFTAWLALFVAQAALIAAKLRAPHRQLGIMGALLFGAMLSLGYSTAITAGRLGHAPPGAPAALAFMALPLIAFTGTAVLVAAALWNRRRNDWHKRLMLASLFSVTGPATHRLAVGAGFIDQGIAVVFIVADVLLVIAMAYDYLRTRRVHPAYGFAAAVFAVTNIAVLWAFGSGAWMSFARAITQT